MHTKRSIMLRVLLNRYHQSTGLDNFLKTQPKELAESILAIDVASLDPSPAFDRPEDVLKKIHYTWVAQAISRIPPEMQGLMLSILPDNMMSSVAKLLNQKSEPAKLSPPMKVFFLHKLLPALERDKVLAPEFLPKSALNPLLDLSKNEILDLVDFLGIYDLAHEMRHIVDKKTIKNIYTCLSLQKQQFLRTCLHQKEKLNTPRLDLEKWNGDSKVLETQLHNRGMLRLGKAMAGQHSDFIWHVVHGLDTGRGKILTKYAAGESPAISTALTQQVINVLNFLKQKSEP